MQIQLNLLLKNQINKMEKSGNLENLEETNSIQTEECICISSNNKDILNYIDSNFNAIEFRVDMFLHKLCSIWTKPEYLPNKLTQYYIGKDIPKSQIETTNIIFENIEYYKDCIGRAISVMKMMCNIPIIYTVRSKQDGGMIDTSKEFTLYNSLVLFGATNMKSDIIDIEFQYEENIKEIKKIISKCTNSLVLISKHFIKHECIFDHQQLVYSLNVHERNFDIICNKFK